MKKWIRVILLLLVSLAVGFYQERLKISINYLLKEGGRIQDYNQMTYEERMFNIEQQRRDMPYDYYHNHSTIQWFFKLDTSELALCKWIVTAFSLLIFVLLNISLLSVLGVDAYYKRIVLLTYVGLTSLAFVIYCLGYWLGFMNESYAFSRKILGALQSIIPAMICWPAAALRDSNSKSETHE